MGDPRSAPELGARTCTEGGAGDNAYTQKRELELQGFSSVGASRQENTNGTSTERIQKGYPRMAWVGRDL